MPINYKDAGVDVDAGDSLVDWLTSSAPKNGPHQDKIISGIGGFASLFRADFKKMTDPCLVSGTDGVGTKLKLAFQLKKYDTVGQDLVAMCVNDLLTTGAEPLFFLDYFATGKLELSQAKDFLHGLRNACVEAGVALIGGETAEMPGFYPPGEFDCAGFAVGVVDKPLAKGAHLVREGDVAIGVASTGFHSNGYSLVRRLFDKDLSHYGSQLLTPTALYTRLVKDVMRCADVHAMAHITGSGFLNLPRVLPAGYGVKLKRWDWPDLFKEAQKRAQISEVEMLRTFNCGIGWVFIAPAESSQRIIEACKNLGYASYDLGVVEKGIDGISEEEFHS